MIAPMVGGMIEDCISTARQITVEFLDEL